MKAYSLSFKVVQFVFQNNENCPSCDVLNGHRYSKNSKKVEYLMNHCWDAIQAMGVKFLLDTYDHLGYPHTKFRPILRGHVQNFGELIWNYPILILVALYIHIS